MAINIKFDLLNNPEPPTLILANRNGNKLGQLEVNADSVELIDKFNEASEISFTVNKYLDGRIDITSDLEEKDINISECPRLGNMTTDKIVAYMGILLGKLG